MLFYAAACGLGVAAGAAFAWLWLRVVPAGTHQRFWSAMSGLTGELIRVDDAGVFLRLYRRLFGLLARYVGRNLGGTLLGCLPMIAILLTAAPALFDAWDARAPRASVVPESAAPLVPPPTKTRTGYCSSQAWCLAFSLLDFDVVEVQGLASYAVSRADRGDANPLWPFLSDLEAAFFAAFILSTFIGLLWPAARRSSSPATSHSSA